MRNKLSNYGKRSIINYEKIEYLVQNCPTQSINAREAITKGVIALVYALILTNITKKVSLSRDKNLPRYLISKLKFLRSSIRSRLKGKLKLLEIEIRVGNPFYGKRNVASFTFL